MSMPGPNQQPPAQQPPAQQPPAQPSAQQPPVHIQTADSRQLQTVSSQMQDAVHRITQLPEQIVNAFREANPPAAPPATPASPPQSGGQPPIQGSAQPPAAPPVPERPAGMSSMRERALRGFFGR